MTGTTPRAPAGLGTTGRAFWRHVHHEYAELEQGETALLTQACRTLDTITELERAAADDGTMITGSAGQPVLHPAITEIRLQRTAFARLLDQLGLPTEDSQAAPASPAARRAQKAAQARWARRTTQGPPAA
jgi:P27 family predicted phage terminase small subunit